MKKQSFKPFINKILNITKDNSYSICLEKLGFIYLKIFLKMLQLLFLQFNFHHVVEFSKLEKNF